MTTTASGASDYCPRCRYDVRLRQGPDACPFNRLYWDFLLRHQGLLGDNPRLRPMYDRLDRLGEGQRAAIHDEAEQVADGIRGDARRRLRRAKSARLRRRRP